MRFKTHDTTAKIFPKGAVRLYIAITEYFINTTYCYLYK